ncbi:dihydropteroate synthase [Candidatus Omnitrophota bacterium]
MKQRNKFILKAGDAQIRLGPKTCLMGIINMTPDSFSHDGCLTKPNDTHKKALYQAKRFIRDGADILDIGGESSRPGAKKISIKEEKARVLPLIDTLAKTTKMPLSIDTYKPAVAKAALDKGATIVNNIMGVNADPTLLKMVREYKAAIVLMHTTGTPQTMQKNIHYKCLMDDIFNSLKNAVEKCLEIGINSDRIIIDPGIGFGKTVEHNLQIINHCDQFKKLKKPILIGASRKSFIGALLNQKENNRLIGSIASVCASVLNGAHIVRVHDVKATKEALTVTDAIANVKTI